LKYDSPHKTEVDHLQDLKKYEGKELGLTEWIGITQDQINRFARLTDDEQWIHVDVERSERESPYETTVAHGFLILSFCSRFIFETLTIQNKSIGLNYGLNRVRFPNAVKVNNEIRGRVTLKEFIEIDRGARLIFEIIFEIKGETKPACVSENISQCYVT